MCTRRGLRSQVSGLGSRVQGEHVWVDLDDEVEVALLVVVRGGCVGTHHGLAIDVRVQEHMLARRQAQSVLGGGQCEAEKADVRTQLWVVRGWWSVMVAEVRWSREVGLWGKSKP